MPTLNPWLILGAFVAIIGTAAASFGYGHHVEYLSFMAYRKSQEAAAAKQVADNKAALLAQQTADFAKMASINQTRSGEIDAITQSRDALLAANRSLNQRLYVRVPSPRIAGVDVPQAASGVSVDAQAGSIGLSPQLASFLIDKFTQADRTAADYAALQQVIISDREICNGTLPGAAPSQ